MTKEGRKPPKENVCFKPLKIPLVFALTQLADSGLMYTHKHTNGHTHWSGYSHQWKRDCKRFWKTEPVQVCLWLKLSAVSCGPEHSPGLGGGQSYWQNPREALGLGPMDLKSKNKTRCWKQEPTRSYPREPHAVSPAPLSWTPGAFTSPKPWASSKKLRTLARENPHSHASDPAQTHSGVSSWVQRSLAGRFPRGTCLWGAGLYSPGSPGIVQGIGSDNKQATFYTKRSSPMLEEWGTEVLAWAQNAKVTHRTDYT